MLFENEGQLNLEYALGFVMSDESVIKMGAQSAF